nr:hypothetical protein [Tanacetum cinerariifolium]
MATVLTSMDAATVLASGVVDVPTGSGSIPTASTPAEGSVPTSNEKVPTASPVFTTATVVARELEEQLEKEDQRRAEQIARDAEIERIHANEELQSMIDGLDSNNETVAKYLKEYRQVNKESHGPRRKGINLEQESAKKQKSSEEITEEAKSPEEKVKEMIHLVPIEEVYVEALQVKHPIIDWKVHLEGQRSYWKITRLGGSSASKDIEIFMLLEKDYPLRKGLALVMIFYKLQVENFSQMENELVLKIYKIANSPRHQEITPIDQAHQFVSPLSGDVIMDFVNELRYTEVIHFVSRMAAQIPSSSDALGHNYNPTKKDRKDKTYVIPYRRFMKLIICHLGRIHNIHQRLTSPFHLAEEDRRPAEKEATKKHTTAKQPKPKPAKEKSSKLAPSLKPKVIKEKSTKPSPAKKKIMSTDETSTRPSAHPQVDTSANIVRDSSSPADADTVKTNSGGDIEILKIDEDQGKDVDKQVNLEEKNVELDQGQAGSDPGKTPESRPPQDKNSWTKTRLDQTLE